MSTASRPSARRIVVLVCACLLGLPASPGARAQEAPPASPVEAASIVQPIPLTGVTSIALGSTHTCAVAGGRVFCWGGGGGGQLGDGTGTSRILPTPVAGLTGVVAVAAGSVHTCALLANGTVRCWGDNYYGQVGDGTTTTRLTPVPVNGLAGVAALDLGGSNSCALTTSHGVRCWGDNAYGQLGDGTTTRRSLPADVSGLTSNVTAMTVGFHHACAALQTGGAVCWGRNHAGQLGDNSTADRWLPVPVNGLAGAIPSLSAASSHTCATRAVGGTWCWGNNDSGQLGTGNTISTLVPASVVALSGTTTPLAVDVGGGQSCALMVSGGARCWGNNSYGQLGIGTLVHSTLAAEVVGLTSALAQVSSGPSHTCARSADGRALCWGANTLGQLGDGTRANRGLPAPVLVPASCYALDATSSGAAGGIPLAVPDRSDGCPLDHFLPGTPVQLLAAPAGGNKVRAWQGVTGGTPGVNVALYAMPAADSAINVLYGTCRTLTLQVSGGGPLLASPALSLGCGNGKYGVSDRITLVASPSATQRVQSWTGAAVSPGTGMDVNTLVMPDADKTVSVVYEACLALSVSVSGNGDAPIVYPAQSQGCAAAGTFAAGETVTLVARPAPGYLVSGWQGTHDASAFAAAQLTMPATGASVAVTYAPAAHTLYLPSVQR